MRVVIREGFYCIANDNFLYMIMKSTCFGNIIPKIKL